MFHEQIVQRFCQQILTRAIHFKPDGSKLFRYRWIEMAGDYLLADPTLWQTA